MKSDTKFLDKAISKEATEIYITAGAKTVCLPKVSESLPAYIKRDNPT